MQTLHKVTSMVHVLRGMPRAIRPAALITLVLVSLPVCAGTLTVYGNLVPRSCDIELLSGSNLAFGTLSYRDFTDNAGTASVLPIHILVRNCNLASNTQPKQAYVQVQAGGGTVTQQSGHIFSDKAVSKTGFMLRELASSSGGQTVQWTQPLSAFYSLTESVVDGGHTYAQAGGATTMLDDGDVLNYAVGYVQTDTKVLPEPEQVSAELTFTFKYN